MLRVAAVCVLFIAIQALPQPIDESFKPYSYGYDAQAEGGRHSASQSADGNGRVTGQYTLADEDGRSRIVEYVADELGFRANIKTNEPGTQNDSPADVQLDANPIPAAETPIRYAAPKPAPVRVVAAPQPIHYVAAAPRPVQYATRPVQYVQPSAYRYTHPGYGYGHAGYGYGHGYGHGLSYGLGYGSGYGSRYGSPYYY